VTAVSGTATMIECGFHGPAPALCSATPIELGVPAGRRTRIPGGLTYISGMLRMRPKPPAGLRTINAGTPWSEMDLSDLEELIRERRSIVEIRRIPPPRGGPLR
jgi:hypothetical protein